MTAIYKRELRSYLTSMIGYIFIFFILLLTGIYFSAYQLSAAYPKFEYTLSALTFVFLISVPILTMRILAEERKQKTDQLLLTSPVSVEKIVMGKYLALVTVFAIPMAIICFLPASDDEVRYGFSGNGLYGNPGIFPSGLRQSGCRSIYLLSYRKPGDRCGADFYTSVCFLHDERNLLLLFRRSPVHLHHLRTSDTGGCYYHLHHDQKPSDLRSSLRGGRSCSGRPLCGEFRILRGRHPEGSAGI